MSSYPAFECRMPPKPWLRQVPDLGKGRSATSKTSPADSSPPAIVGRGDVAIRRATAGDSETIAGISAAVNVRTFAEFGRGFLVYSLDALEYLRRINDRQHVFVFEVQRCVAGFVCGYSPETLRRYVADGTLAHESSIGRAVLKFADDASDRTYSFLDSIAVSPEFQDRGVGERAFSALCRAVPMPYYVAMIEAPMRNPRIEYWCRRGFERVGQVFQPAAERFRVLDNNAETPSLLWGIYVLRHFKTRRSGTPEIEVAHE